MGETIGVPEPSETGAPRRTLAITDRIADTYEIEAVIGSGGMGTVYRARDRILRRDVAIKLAHGDLLVEAGVREAFLAEARSMAGVHHPNVVTIHTFGVHEDQPYIVMELLDGVNLGRWMAERGRPSLEESMGILDALCRGVDAIHRAGALHRDIKPGNVLIGKDGRVAVTDFGLSIPPTRLDDEATVGIGTPAYLAPEIAREETIDPEAADRIDVYAIALVAFELLTGRRPFPHRNVAAMLHAHGHTPPPCPSDVRPELPAAFDAPLLRALAKSPANRTPSVEALRRDLQRAHASVAEYPSGLKILNVDDEHGTLVAIRELLLMEFPAAEILSVASTTTAIEIAKREQPDLIITDFEMPDGGAPELIRALRSDPNTEDVPIIVVTARGGATDWHDLRSLGANRFLVKPVDFDALGAMIRRLVPGAR
jgi:eukaryotic-like serine/threonine-protein kinase